MLSVPIDLNCINSVPVAPVFLMLAFPAVPPETKEKPFNLHLPAKITPKALLLIPAETLPAGLPTAVILVIVLK